MNLHEFMKTSGKLNLAFISETTGTKGLKENLHCQPRTHLRENLPVESNLPKIHRPEKSSNQRKWKKMKRTVWIFLTYSAAYKSIKQYRIHRRILIGYILVVYNS